MFDKFSGGSRVSNVSMLQFAAMDESQITSSTCPLISPTPYITSSNYVLGIH
jgi:hypothetical protein